MRQSSSLLPFQLAPHQEVPHLLLSFTFQFFSKPRARYFDSHRVHHHFIYSCSPSRLLNHLITNVSFTNTSSHIHLATIRSALFLFIFLAISVQFLPVLSFPVLFFPILFLPVLFLPALQSSCQPFHTFLSHQLTLSATSANPNASQITRPSSLSPLTFSSHLLSPSDLRLWTYQSGPGLIRFRRPSNSSLIHSPSE